MLDLTPEQAARMLAFIGYDEDAITEYLTGQGVEDARSLARIMVGQKQLTEQQEARTIERGQRAVAAEHDLTASNWR